MKKLIESGEVDLGWTLGHQGEGEVEIIWYDDNDADKDVVLDGTIVWGVYGQNTRATRLDPAEYAEGEISEVTIEAFGRTYDITEEFLELVGGDEIQEKCIERAAEAEADAADYWADRRMDEMRDDGMERGSW